MERKGDVSVIKPSSAVGMTSPLPPSGYFMLIDRHSVFPGVGTQQ